MKFEIKHRFTGAILFSLETESMRLCVEAAVKSGAYLGGADLRGAYLGGAYLGGAKNAELPLAQLCIVSECGDFVGWKKLDGGIIARLRIPQDSERMNAYGFRKCRASCVVVEAMFQPDGKPFDGVAKSKHDNKTEYKIGAIVTPDSYDPSPTVECSHGIQFFITRIEAENY